MVVVLTPNAVGLPNSHSCRHHLSQIPDPPTVLHTSATVISQTTGTVLRSLLCQSPNRYVEACTPPPHLMTNTLTYAWCAAHHPAEESVPLACLAGESVLLFVIFDLQNS